MPNPKQLPKITGTRVPMANRFSFGARFGYPWDTMRLGDFFIVPESMRTAEMVRQAVCRRGKRHGEQYQTKLTDGGIMVVRIK
jgi:hypothetical protein